MYIPKSYHRFAGLIEKLYKEKTITANDQTLLEIKNKTFSELIDEINPKKLLDFLLKLQNSYEKIAGFPDDDYCLSNWWISKRTFF